MSKSRPPYPPEFRQQLVALAARRLGEAETAVTARRRAVGVLRTLGEERERLVALSVALYNLAGDLAAVGQHEAAVEALEEVVALDERTGHPDLESDRRALEAARARAGGKSLARAVQDWVADGRPLQPFMELLNAICNVVVGGLREGTVEVRETLRRELDHLVEAAPLPLEGAEDFIRVLQAWLEGREAEVAKLRAGLPADLAAALETMEKSVAAEAQAAPAPPPLPEVLRELIDAWRRGPRDAAAVADLLARVCSLTVLALKAEEPDLREALAHRLDDLLTVGPLAIEGAEDLVRVLQAWLRGHEPGDTVALAPPLRGAVEHMRTLLTNDEADS